MIRNAWGFKIGEGGNNGTPGFHSFWTDLFIQIQRHIKQDREVGSNQLIIERMLYGCIVHSASPWYPWIHHLVLIQQFVSPYCLIMKHWHNAQFAVCFISSDIQKITHWKIVVPFGLELNIAVSFVSTAVGSRQCVLNSKLTLTLNPTKPPYPTTPFPP